MSTDTPPQIRRMVGTETAPGEPGYVNLIPVLDWLESEGMVYVRDRSAERPFIGGNMDGRDCYMSGPVTLEMLRQHFDFSDAYEFLTFRRQAIWDRVNNLHLHLLPPR